MKKSGRYVFRVAFIGLPDEFRRAHRNQLEAIGAQCCWVERAESLANEPPFHALVINLDDEKSAVSESRELLRSKHLGVETIAVSSRDSAQFAMECLREGFSDFLSPPVSPDELALCLLRCKQRQDPANQGAFAASFMGRALTQISGASSLETLRLRTAAALQNLLKGTESQWRKSRRSLASDRAIYRTSKGDRRVVIPCQQDINGQFVVKGIPGRLTREKLDEAVAIVGHAELSMLHLRQVAKLKHQTFVDDLTGLYNSRYLKFAMESAVRNHRLKNEPFALLFIDVDHFKSVNDRHGHLVGSEFLCAMGRIIKNAVRTGDYVFRYGGDEFVILLRKASTHRGQEIAERLRRQIAERQFFIRGVSLRATVSIGLAVYPDHALQIDLLTQLADAAMYQAKRTRNAVQTAPIPSPRKRPAKRPEPTL